MPDLDENSEKLHIVVGLLAGMGEDPYSGRIVNRNVS